MSKPPKPTRTNPEQSMTDTEFETLQLSKLSNQIAKKMQDDNSEALKDVDVKYVANKLIAMSEQEIQQQTSTGAVRDQECRLYPQGSTMDRPVPMQATFNYVKTRNRKHDDAHYKWCMFHGSVYYYTDTWR